MAHDTVNEAVVMPEKAERDAHHSPVTEAQVTETLASQSRRDFINLAAVSMAAISAAAAATTVLNSMNPAADTLALSTAEVDLAPIEPGQAITIKWRGKPVFIRHRTPENIKAAAEVDLKSLRDPQADGDRVQKPEWLVMVGICTHLGCVPLGQKETDPQGDFGGWFCPCHGSHYDTAGRIRKGPAPKNLEVPTYSFLSPTRIRIG